MYTTFRVCRMIESLLDQSLELTVVQKRLRNVQYVLFLFLFFTEMSGTQNTAISDIDAQFLRMVPPLQNCSFL